MSFVQVTQAYRSQGVSDADFWDAPSPQRQTSQQQTATRPQPRPPGNRSAPARSKAPALTRRERVDIAISTNKEFSRLRDDALQDAFEQDLVPEQQAAHMQAFVDALQILVAQRGNLMDPVNVATLLQHLAAVLTHSDAHPAAVARVNYDR